MAAIKKQRGLPLEQPDVIEPGNIDLFAQPSVPAPGGGMSTVRSMSFNEDGAEVLIPTAVGGMVVSNDEAIAAYRRTGRHLGKFRTVAAATRYAIKLHKDYEAGRYGPGRDPRSNP